MPDSSDFPLLKGIEDYPRWVQHATAQLQEKACLDAVVLPTVKADNDSAIAFLLDRGFAAETITQSMIYSWIEKTDARQKKQESEAIGILKGLVGAQNQQSIQGKSAFEIWNILRTKFKDISPMSLMEAIQKMSFVRMSNFESPSLYCDAFRTALDQVSGMIQPDSLINQKGVEGLLQGFMLNGVTDTYKPVVLQLRKDWKNENTSLSEACLSLERYDFKNIIGDFDTTNGTKALHTKVLHPNRAPKGTCDFGECVESGLTSHYNDRCWKRYPQLKPKHALSRMKTRNTGPGKPSAQAVPSATAPAPTPATGNLTS